MSNLKERVLAELPEFPRGKTLTVIALSLHLVDIRDLSEPEEKDVILRRAEKKVLKAIDSLSFVYPITEMTIPVQKATKEALARYGIEKKGLMVYYSLVPQQTEGGV